MKRHTPTQRESGTGDWQDSSDSDDPLSNPFPLRKQKWKVTRSDTGPSSGSVLGVTGPKFPPEMNVTQDMVGPQHNLTANIRLSLFSSATEPTPRKEVTLAELVGMVCNPPEFLSIPFKRCREIHATGNKDAYRNAKKELPGVTLGGSFQKRGNAHLNKHSGLMVVDLDHIKGEELRVAREQVETDPHCVLLYLSPSGEGLKGGLLLKDTPHDDTDHKRAFAGVKNYLQKRYGLVVDPPNKDVSRLSFLSCDPSCFYNPNARPLDLEGWLDQKELPPLKPDRNRTADKDTGANGDRVSREKVEATLFRIPPRPDYQDWIRIAAAVRNSLGDTDLAVEMLNRWSPEEQEGEYERLLSSSSFSEITFGTLFHYARQHGMGDFQPIIQAHGEAFILNHKGQPAGFNPMFIPAVYTQRNHVLHDALQRTFYEYEEISGLWKATTPDTMRRKLSDLTTELGKELSQPNLALKEQFDGKLSGALNNLRALTDSRFDDRPTGYIHCLNGMLDVRSGELLPFNPEFKSRNQTPFNWDEEATCPNFLNELLSSALDEDDINAIQLYVGMALMGRNLAQIVLILTGTAGGGKSQLVIVIEGLIGRENCTELRTELLNERFELARFIGKTLLTGKDVPGNFLMTKGAMVIKKLSGGDSLDTEIKGKMGSDKMDGDYSMVITSNNRLRVKLDGDTDAWRRRLLIVDYNRPKPERPIPDFGRKLLAQEGSGILRWCVEGARRLLELEYQFPMTCTQKGRVNALLDESNALRCFVSSQIEASHGNDLTSSEITDAFYSYCDSNDWIPGSNGEILCDLPAVMMEIHRSSKSNSIQRSGKASKGFRGVRFVDPFRNGTLGTAH